MDMKQETKNIMLVFGAILTSVGLREYIPVGTEPLFLVVGGIALSYAAINAKF
jgi:hypothetical protein